MFTAPVLFAIEAAMPLKVYQLLASFELIHTFGLGFTL